MIKESPAARSSRTADRLRIASVMFAAAAVISVVVAIVLALIFQAPLNLVVSWILAGLAVVAIGLSVLIRSRGSVTDEPRRD